MLNLPNLVGAPQDHHDLDVALVRRGTHPCLHKLATTRPAPHPKVIARVDEKLKRVNNDMTREQLVEHCRLVIERQRPSNTVNEAHINGSMVITHCHNCNTLQSDSCRGPAVKASVSKRKH